jgi:hypothetical protein
MGWLTVRLRVAGLTAWLPAGNPNIIGKAENIRLVLRFV